MPEPLPAKRIATGVLIAATLGAAVFGAKDATAAGEPAAPALAPASLSMVIGADGAARDIACGPTTSAALCPLLSKAVAGWQFEPGLRDGKPADVPAILTLELLAVPKDGGFNLRVPRADLSVAPRPSASPGTVQRAPPVYPADQLRRGKPASVVLEWWFATDTEKAHLGKAWRDGRAAKGSDPFVAAAMNAVRQWKDLPHVPEQLSYCLRMDFSTDEASARNAASSMDTGECQSSFAPGFQPPRLVTAPQTATL